MDIYTARHILPVSAPPLTDGAVAVQDGRIVHCGPRIGPARDLGEAVIFPGLVNAHTHLELSWMGENRPAGGDYAGWVRELLRLRETAPRPDVRREAAASALEGMIERGAVAVADIGNEGWTVELLAATPLHAIAFLEIYGTRPVSISPGVVPTPHAPHTTPAPVLRELAALGTPLSIHVAESSAEVDFLRHGTGPLADLLARLGTSPAGITPVEYLHRLGVLGPRTLAVHCVALEERDIELLRATSTHVVTCPRSNRYLGVGTAPLERILAAGIPVALGTDSLASAPDLDLFAEMAAVREVHPDIPAPTVLRMATLAGATALGFGDSLGSIEPGKLALLNVAPLPAGADPHEFLCSVPERVERLA